MVTDFRASIPLILLAQAGDRQALAQLLQGSQDALHAYLRRLVNDEHLAEDILQDVFVLIWRKLQWLRDPALFRPWAYRIASRAAFRRLKKERLWTSLLGEPSLAAVAQQERQESVPQEWLDQLPSHLAGLSPASRAVLLLHYLQGLTLDEVAGVLALPPGTVKSRLSYGLAILRQRLRNKESPA